MQSAAGAQNGSVGGAKLWDALNERGKAQLYTVLYPRPGTLLQGKHACAYTAHTDTCVRAYTHVHTHIICKITLTHICVRKLLTHAYSLLPHAHTLLTHDAHFSLGNKLATLELALQDFDAAVRSEAISPAERDTFRYSLGLAYYFKHFEVQDDVCSMFFECVHFLVSVYVGVCGRQTCVFSAGAQRGRFPF